MREKNGLDRCASNSIAFSGESFSKKESRTKAKVVKFNEKAPHCENFTLKDGEVRSKIYWCKKTNKSCTFKNCPKNNNKGVND